MSMFLLIDHNAGNSSCCVSCIGIVMLGQVGFRLTQTNQKSCYWHLWGWRGGDVKDWFA